MALASVRHTAVLYQNGASYRITKASLCAALKALVFVPLGEGVPLERGRQRVTPFKKTLFCRYWRF